MRTGKYAYQFSGSAMSKGIHFHLVGVGIMTLESGGAISGRHTASLTPLQGMYAAIDVRRFNLVGHYGPRPGGDDDDVLEAQITFTELDNNNTAQVLKAKFSLVPAGENRFWMISTGAFNETSNLAADEVVSGEAVLMTGA